MDNPKVSVIINCFNGARYLRQAVDSVYAQTYKNWEIIFWDNASIDSSREIVKNYDNRLRYFRSEKTSPLSHARNLAIQKASGKYIAFVDCDDIWLPSKLDKQIPLLERNQLAGLIFSDEFDFYQEYGLYTLHFRNILGKSKPARGRIFPYLLKTYFIPMPTVVLRASIFFSHNEWFDNNYKHSPDYELFLRIAYKWECDYVDEPLAIYRIHGNSATERNHKNLATELSYAFDKFSKYFPDFHQRYGREAVFVKKLIAYNRGKSYWRMGMPKEARMQFKACKPNPKIILAYMASAFPYKRMIRIWNKFRYFLLKPKSKIYEEFIKSELASREGKAHRLPLPVTQIRKDGVKKYFNDISDEYSSSCDIKKDIDSVRAYIFSTRKKYVLDMFSLKGGRVLDVGCGPAVLTEDILKNNCEVWGIDISEDIIRLAHKRMEGKGFGEKIHFSIGDIERLEFPDAYFDFVLCIGVLEYLPDINLSLKEIHRVLRGGGEVILSLPNLASPLALFDKIAARIIRLSLGMLRLIKIKIEQPPGRLLFRSDIIDRYYLPWELDEALKKSGFKINKTFFHAFRLAALNAASPKLALFFLRRLEFLVNSPLRWMGINYIVKASKQNI